MKEAGKTWNKIRWFIQMKLSGDLLEPCAVARVKSVDDDGGDCDCY